MASERAQGSIDKRDGESESRGSYQKMRADEGEHELLQRRQGRLHACAHEGKHHLTYIATGTVQFTNVALNSATWGGSTSVDRRICIMFVSTAQ